MISGCSSNTPSKELHKPLPTPTRQTSDGITPNGESLWKVNRATNTGVANMVQLLNSFQNTDDIKAYANLHKQLDDEVLTIFTKCNMKGEGHNQLHNFLLPLYEDIEKLKNGDLNGCQETFIRLRKRLAIYPLYFE